MLLTGGKILDANGAYVVGHWTIDRQDGSPIFTATNADDGNGNWSISDTNANDFTLSCYIPSLKCQGVSFHLSNVAKVPFLSYDPVTGKLDGKFPFA